MGDAKASRRVLTVVMDGVGVRPERFGNAVALAHTPHLRFLQEKGLYTTILAHGTHVGLPSDSDIGNSEVGHNALGAGRIFDQGAKLVQQAIANGSLFAGASWRMLMTALIRNQHTLHFLGLLSNGNVHSHEDHLYAMLRRAASEGVKRLRVHVLFDGRDVPDRSAELFAARLEGVLSELRQAGCDADVASGGGRMQITMDRYEADWGMVERGWRVHVLGEGRGFRSLDEALKTLRQEKPEVMDQYLPEFVIRRADGQPVGAIADGDGVVFFNFRGDRAIEISRAFTEDHFDKFERSRFPKVYFAGMMEYDGDLHIPPHFLVSPPEIEDTLSEYLSAQGARQFACSETQKFGHVTYFWNGNRSGHFDKEREEYVEIPSDLLPFDQKPWMKAYEITQATTARMLTHSFDFGRINYANGDMVGHTGDLSAAIIAVATVDLMLGRLIAASQRSDTILVVTADHGNCDEMFDAKPAAFPHWEDELWDASRRPRPKTAHTLAPVPFYVYDPRGKPREWSLREPGQGRLSQMANTVLQLMGLKERELYDESLLRRS